MGDFDSTNGTDEGDINTKLSSIKLTFDETANVEFSSLSWKCAWNTQV